MYVLGFYRVDESTENMKILHFNSYNFDLTLKSVVVHKIKHRAYNFHLDSKNLYKA